VRDVVPEVPRASRDGPQADGRSSAIVQRDRAASGAPWGEVLGRLLRSVRTVFVAFLLPDRRILDHRSSPLGPTTVSRHFASGAAAATPVGPRTGSAVSDGKACPDVWAMARCES
jgi:hypothetical protein